MYFKHILPQEKAVWVAELLYTYQINKTSILKGQLHNNTPINLIATYFPPDCQFNDYADSFVGKNTLMIWDNNINILKYNNTTINYTNWLNQHTLRSLNKKYSTRYNHATNNHTLTT